MKCIIERETEESLSYLMQIDVDGVVVWSANKTKALQLPMAFAEKFVERASKFIKPNVYRVIPLEGWSKEWPIEPGHYWFYGYSVFDQRFDEGQTTSPKYKLRNAKVRKTVNGFVYTTEGQFLYKQEFVDAFWHLNSPPELPEV